MTTAWRTSVSANYRMFGLHDPTCAERENFAVAIAGASADLVGWAANALMIEVVSDVVSIAVGVEVSAEAPASDASADLIRDGRLALPGGFVSVPQSVDDGWQRGVELPGGPGTYGVRICGYGRFAARKIWSQDRDIDDVDGSSAARALSGVEHYRICLWQVSPEPRWSDDEE